MTNIRRSMELPSRGARYGLLSIAAMGILALSQSAYSASVEHVVVELEDALGTPAIQAQIVACLGEEVFFTGTVRITTRDGVTTNVKWLGMTGETADGDVFMASSVSSIGKQSNLTLIEVGVRQDGRQFRMRTVGSDVFVICR